MSYYTYLTKNIKEPWDLEYLYSKITLQALFGDEQGMTITIQRFISQDISISQEKKVSLDLSGVSLTVDSIWNFFVNLIKGNNRNRRDISVSDVLDILAILFKSWALEREYAGMIQAVKDDVSGAMGEVLAFVFGGLSVALAIAGLTIHNLIVSGLALGFGLVGLLLGIFVKTKVMGETVKLHNIITWAIAGTGLVFGFTAFTLSLTGGG